MSSARVWWRGARPRTLVAGIAPVVVGGAASGASLWQWEFAAALVVAAALQIGVNLANDATDPLTSQSTTSSVRCGRLGRWWVVIGTPPVEMEARTVRRKSSGPRRRWEWCSWLSRVASRRASG